MGPGLSRRRRDLDAPASISSQVDLLERYLSGEFDESVVEAWADAIECRGDIGISQEGKDDIRIDLRVG